VSDGSSIRIYRSFTIQTMQRQTLGINLRAYWEGPTSRKDGDWSPEKANDLLGASLDFSLCSGKGLLTLKPWGPTTLKANYCKGILNLGLHFLAAKTKGGTY
jgi:hypothetical protein